MQKIALLLFHALIVYAFGYLGSTLSTDFNISDVLGKNSKEVKAYNEYKKKYDDERSIYLLVIGKKNSLFKFTDDLTNKLLGFKGLDEVNSFSLVQYLDYDQKEKRIKLKQFFKDDQLTQEGRDLLLKNGLFKNSYLNQEEDSSLITLKIQKNLSKKDVSHLIERLEKLKEKESKPHYKLHLLGSKVASYHFSKELFDQQKVISPLSLILLTGFLLFVFRSMSTVFLGLYYMTIVFILSGIILFAFEDGITPYTNFSLFFIYVMATSDFIHFCHSYSKAKGNLEEKLKESVRNVVKPCFYTTLTTATAFLSLSFSSIEIIADFGIYSGIGIIISFVVNFYFLPYVLKTFSIDIKIHESNVLQWFDRNYLSHLKKLKIIGALSSGIVVLLFIPSIFNLNFDDSLYDKFVKDHTMTKSVYAFNEKFSFTGSIDLVRPITRLQLLEPKFEKETKSFVEKVEEIDNVSVVRGVSKYLSYIRSEVGTSSAQSYSSSAELRNILNLVRKQKLLADNYNNIYNEEKVTIYIKSLKSSELKKTIDKVKDIIEESGLNYELNGFAPIRLKMLNSILDGFLYNLLGTFLVIFIIFCFAFKSLKYGLIAMIPNIFPIMVIIILMSFFNIAIEDSLLLMLASIIGISVDDTLHYMFSYLKQEKELSHEEKVRRVFSQTHFALFATTFLFIIVSPTYFISNLSLIHKMAIFFNIGLLVALVCDFYILPFVLKITEKEKHEV